jgi:hypothetical protein
MITSWASFNQVFGQTWIMLIEAGRCWHLSDLSAALRDFNSAYVADGSWLCQNSSTRGGRRNILEKLHI